MPDRSDLARMEKVHAGEYAGPMARASKVGSTWELEVRLRRIDRSRFREADPDSDWGRVGRRDTLKAARTSAAKLVGGTHVVARPLGASGRPTISLPPGVVPVDGPLREEIEKARREGVENAA